jgi:hypothetical protein
MRPGSFQLVIGNRSYALKSGVRLTEIDIAILKSSSHDRIVAEVSTNPANREVLGLRNRSTVSWTAIKTSRQTKVINPEQSIKLEDGLQIVMDSQAAYIKQAGVDKAGIQMGSYERDETDHSKDDSIWVRRLTKGLATGLTLGIVTGLFFYVYSNRTPGWGYWLEQMPWLNRVLQRNEAECSGITKRRDALGIDN